MNTTTRQSVAEEVYNILQSFHIPYAKMYHSNAYDKSFLIAVAIELKDKLPEYQVSLTRNVVRGKCDYVMEIKRWEMEI